MTELIKIVQIFLMGGLGVLAMIFMKINDITQTNPNMGFWQVASLYRNKAAASYLASLSIVLAYCITRNDIMYLFAPDEQTSSLLKRLLGLHMLLSLLIGLLMQWGIYKFFFKKVDGVMKIWCGDPKTGAPDVNTPATPLNVEKAKENAASTNTTSVDLVTGSRQNRHS